MWNFFTTLPTISITAGGTTTSLHFASGSKMGTELNPPSSSLSRSQIQSARSSGRRVAQSAAT